jgi:hypothetical protein
LDDTIPGLTVATLNLPAGSYSILGRVQIHGVLPVQGGLAGDASCTLAAENDTETVRTSGIGAFLEYDGVITLNVLHKFAGAGAATIQCNTRNVGGLVSAANSRITGIQVTTIQ